jgi:hypothetical protein
MGRKSIAMLTVTSSEKSDDQRCPAAVKPSMACWEVVGLGMKLKVTASDCRDGAKDAAVAAANNASARRRRRRLCERLDDNNAVNRALSPGRKAMQPQRRRPVYRKRELSLKRIDVFGR